MEKTIDRMAERIKNEGAHFLIKQEQRKLDPTSI